MCCSFEKTLLSHLQPWNWCNHCYWRPQNCLPYIMYAALPPVLSVLIQTPESLLFETTLPFSNNVRVSTAGLEASTTQVKFATMPTQTLCFLDKLVVKVTPSGASEWRGNNNGVTDSILHLWDEYWWNWECKHFGKMQVHEFPTIIDKMSNNTVIIITPIKHLYLSKKVASFCQNSYPRQARGFKL